MAYLLHQLLSHSASQYPDKEAIAFQDSTMTYAELDDESNQLAHVLLEINEGRGTLVGIYLNRCMYSIVAAFAVLKSGAAYVPIDPLCPPDRLGYIASKCGISTVITTKDKLETLGQVFSSNVSLVNIILMDGLEASVETPGASKVIDWQVKRKAERFDPPVTGTIGSDLAYVLFTSGSTGHPKGVMLSHLNSLTFVNAAQEVFPVTQEDRFSNVCPLHFDMSVFDIFVAIKVGATIVVIPETTSIFPAKLAETIDKNKISVWNSVPSALSLLAAYKNLDRHDLSNLRMVLFAGEKFPIKYLRCLQETLPAARFCNMYGQTEANSSTYYWVEKLSPDFDKPLPIGKTLPNFDVLLINENGEQIAAPGREGELYVRSSTVALGYWDDIEKTGISFLSNPLRPELNERVYKTGDMASLDSDGNLVFMGRKDQMLKSRGYRIETGEIEMVLSGHPGVETAVVVPIPDELVGMRINVLVVPANQNVDKVEVLKFCTGKLPRYMVPEDVKFCDSLPKTSSGKIDRRKLRELYEVIST